MTYNGCQVTQWWRYTSIAITVNIISNDYTSLLHTTFETSGSAPLFNMLFHTITSLQRMPVSRQIRFHNRYDYLAWWLGTILFQIPLQSMGANSRYTELFYQYVVSINTYIHEWIYIRPRWCINNILRHSFIDIRLFCALLNRMEQILGLYYSRGFPMGNSLKRCKYMRSLLEWHGILKAVHWKVNSWLVCLISWIARQWKNWFIRVKPDNLRSRWWYIRVKQIWSHDSIA